MALEFACSSSDRRPGRAGIMGGHPWETWMRDAKLLQVAAGTSEVQREVVARLNAAGG
jgi:alkylation response protein AidB-like acyl-CoA dehydrogenase